MAGRPVHLETVLQVKKLRNNKNMSYREIVEWFAKKGKKTDVKTVFRWYNYDVGKIVDKSS